MSARRRKQAARRPDAARARSGKRRRWLPLPFLAGCVALVAWAVAEGVSAPPAPDFPIRTLKVEAAFERVAAQEIAAVVAPLVAGGFFETDVGAVKQQVVALPWVRDATVRRVWPDAVHVTVIEQTAVANWAAGEGLLNEDGEVFRPADGTRIAGLPRLEGPPRTSALVMERYRQLNERLEPLGLRIERLAMDPRRAWALTLDNGVTLTLGRRDAGEQIGRFARYWPGAIAARAAEIEGIDLRYPSGFAVRWREGGAPAAHAGAAGTTGGKG